MLEPEPRKIHLENKDYTGVYSEQIKYIGETRAAIRYLDFDDKRDMKRLLSTIRHPRVKKFVDGLTGMDISDVRGWADEYKDHTGFANDGEWMVLFGIAGTPSNPSIKNSQIGEYQGFVNCYSSPGDREQTRSNARLLGRRIIQATDIVELSVAKWPPAPSGQVDSAIRQVCLEINRIKGKSLRNDTGKHSKKSEPDMLIVAYIEPQNIHSRKVFELSGFINRGETKYVGDNGKVESDLLYELDWKKLNQIVHKNADRAVDA